MRFDFLTEIEGLRVSLRDTLISGVWNAFLCSWKLYASLSTPITISSENIANNLKESLEEDLEIEERKIYERDN